MTLDDVRKLRRAALHAADAAPPFSREKANAYAWAVAAAGVVWQRIYEREPTHFQDVVDAFVWQATR
jgi:hypothetical protein